MNVSEPPDPRRARHRPSGRTVGRAVISAELVVLFVLFTLWQGPSSGGPGHGPTPTLAAPDTTTAGTSPKATTISPTSTSTPAWLLDATPTAEPAPVLEEVAVPSSTATAPPVSTPAATAAPRSKPPGPAPADSAPATTLPIPVEPPSSSDPTTTPVTTVAPPPGTAPVATQPPSTSTPPESTLPTEPPTTSPPTTIDHRTFCAQLDAQKHAIEAEIAQVGATYKDDPVTRDRLTKQLQAEKNAVEQQRTAAHC